jgi:hypothetical protein
MLSKTIFSRIFSHNSFTAYVTSTILVSSLILSLFPFYISIPLFFLDELGSIVSRILPRSKRNRPIIHMYA